MKKVFRCTPAQEQTLHANAQTQAGATLRKVLERGIAELRKMGVDENIDERETWIIRGAHAAISELFSLIYAGELNEHPKEDPKHPLKDGGYTT